MKGKRKDQKVTPAQERGPFASKNDLRDKQRVERQGGGGKGYANAAVMTATYLFSPVRKAARRMVSETLLCFTSIPQEKDSESKLSTESKMHRKVDGRKEQWGRDTIFKGSAVRKTGTEGVSRGMMSAKELWGAVRSGFEQGGRRFGRAGRLPTAEPIPYPR